MNFESFDRAFAPATQLRKPKTLKQRLVHLIANAVILPIVAVTYVTVSGEGLASILPLLQRRLYSLPVPGAGLLRSFDGWNKLHLGMVVAGLLAMAVAWCWAVFFRTINGQGNLLRQDKSSPIVVILVSICGITMVLADAAIFAAGLSIQTEQGWANAPWFVVPVATLLFSLGIFAIAYWKYDFETSNQI